MSTRWRSVLRGGPSVPSRTVLVTDAMAALGIEGAEARLGDLLVTVDETGVRTPDGVLAGSNLTLDRAVRNLVEFTGCTAAEAVRTVTANPAAVLGLTDRGVIEVGRARRHRRARSRSARANDDDRRAGRMEVVITADAEAAAELVAATIAAVLTTRPEPVLGLATGSSPLAAYRLSDRGPPTRRALGGPRQRGAARRVRRTRRRSSRGVPDVHPARVRRPHRSPESSDCSDPTCTPTIWLRRAAATTA